MILRGGSQGEKTSFSNYGDWLDLCAPGSNIETILYNTTSDNYYYAKLDGTSYSTPIAALVYTILLSAADFLQDEFQMSMTRNDILEAFLISLENVEGDRVPLPQIDSPINTNYNEKFDIYNGYGCVDVFDALNFIGYLFLRNLRADSYTFHVSDMTGTIPLTLEFRVTLSYSAFISSKLHNKYQVKYALEKRSTDGNWYILQTGTLNRVYSGNQYEKWKKTIYLPKTPGDYRVIIYFDQVNKMFTLNNLYMVGGNMVPGDIISISIIYWGNPFFG